MPLKLIGAGLGRTGTASTKAALELLGFGACYHMVEVIGRPTDINRWVSAADGKPDWDAIFECYSATVDYPSCTYWKQLAEHYPDAKILLNVRDPERWFESTQETIMSPAFVEQMKGSQFGELVERTIWSTLEGRMHERDYMIDHFNRHVEDVKRNAPPDRLLVFEVKQGWAPLCEFLGLPIPEAPFPRINSREDTTRLINAALTGSPDVEFTDRMQSAAKDIFGDQPG
jgi:hypothetical protein